MTWLHTPSSLTSIRYPHIFTEDKARDIIEGAFPGAWNAWKQDGNQILLYFFSWIWLGLTYDGYYGPGIGDIVDEEFNMYLHHQGEKNARDNREWLRIMFHSHIQQLIRQDLEYYIWYVCFCPDHNFRLVSYPYYTKYAQPGDKTKFRHLDLNVNSYVKHGKGGNIIQGSVSSDNKPEDGCIELLLDFQRNVVEWWAKVMESNFDINNDVTGLKQIWKKEDSDAYGSL